MGLVYSFNPLGGPVNSNSGGDIIPFPQDYNLPTNANDFSGDPTTATALRNIDSIYYTICYDIGDKTKQGEIISLWSNGTLKWTGWRKGRSRVMNDLITYDASDSSKSWDTHFDALPANPGVNYQMQCEGSTFNIYNNNFLSIQTGLDAFIKYEKATGGDKLRIFIIIPIYIQSLEKTYLCGYIDNASASADVGGIEIQQIESVYMNTVSTQTLESGFIVVNHKAEKAMIGIN